MPIRTFPAFLDLRGRTAFVLGQGPVAERKMAAVQRAGATVVQAERFDPDLLRGCALAVGAGAPERELLALSQAAKNAGIPVNVVDRPELCSFISPAVIDRDPITVAISSAGEAPVLARDIRARIEALLPPGLGRVAALLGSLRTELRAAFPDLPARRRAIDHLLAGPAAALALAGDEAAAREAALQAIDAQSPSVGTVFLVGALPDAPDLLTLRAHRLLGEADVIVHADWISEAVLDLARRDAERVHADPEEVTPLLIRLARPGNRVVWLVLGDPASACHVEAAALEKAGVHCEVVPGVAP